MDNFTGDVYGNLTSTSIQLPTGMAVFLFALNILLSITATLGNALILFVLHRVSSLHPPTKLLFHCLAVTDLFVGLIAQPVGVIEIALYLPYITEININVLSYVKILSSASSLILYGLSVLVSTAISVDRLFALFLGLRYRHVVTLRRVRAGIICFSLIGVGIGSVQYF